MILSILNHKGGTGKTTTTINLGKALVLNHKKVLLIDLDVQANLSYSFGISNNEKNIGGVLFKQYSFEKAIIKREGLDIIPSSSKLFEYEQAIIKNNYGNFLLRDALINATYDFILIDCPPSQSLLNTNALAASDKVLVPMLMDVLSLQGLNQLLKTVNEVKEKLNFSIEVAGILGVLVDDRKQLTKEVIDHIRSTYSVKLFDTFIRANTKAAEAPSHGMSILEYAPESTSARDYLLFCSEFLEVINEPIKTI